MASPAIRGKRLLPQLRESAGREECAKGWVIRDFYGLDAGRFFNNWYIDNFGIRISGLRESAEPH